MKSIKNAIGFQIKGELNGKTLHGDLYFSGNIPMFFIKAVSRNPTDEAPDIVLERDEYIFAISQISKELEPLINEIKMSGIKIPETSNLIIDDMRFL